MKKLKNFLITAAIFAASISFATSVHAVRDYWEKELSEAQAHSNFSKYENVYKNTDLVSEDDYLFAKAIDEKNEDYLAANCSNWKYDKYCTWPNYAVEGQLTFNRYTGRSIPSESFLNFLLEHGIITSAFDELFTLTVFDGHYESFVRNFKRRYPNTTIAPPGRGEGFINVTADEAYAAHQNDLLSTEWLQKMMRYIGPTNLLYALFRHSPDDDTEKFAAAAKFLIDKGAKVNFISKITKDSILEEALFDMPYNKCGPFKVYFLLTHGVDPNHYNKVTRNTKPPLERFCFRYKINYRDCKERTINHISSEQLNQRQLINHILELYKETEGNLPPYEQILSQYKFHYPRPDCCIM